MVRRRFPWLSTLSLSVCIVVCTTGLGVSQDMRRANLSPARSAKPTKKSPPQADLADPAKRKAMVDQLITEYDLSPHPPAPIPDNPPPHEGALISLPYVVGPPDLILVEVLDALPGRPISGERLVRPDGVISLGFYGEVPVRGLTLPQIKVAIIKQLRKYLTDDVLGLVAGPEGADDIAIPELPTEKANPFDRDEATTPAKKTSRTMPSNPSAGKTSVRPGSRHAGRRVPVRPVAVRRRRQEPAAQPVAPKAPPQINIPAGASGRITITIDIGGQARPDAGHAPVGPMPEIVPEAAAPEEPWIIVPPEESNKVFVDVTAYNSMNYHVLGDVLVTGRLPCTGNETVLDALESAGGLVPTADPKQISLVRPQRGGKPARIYKVDLEAIQEKGVVGTDYQIFPGDRLFVGRDEVVKKTVELDRLAAPIHTIVGTMLQEAQVLRSVQTASPDHADDLYKEILDFWLKQLASRGELKFDEQTLRDALMRQRKQTAPAAPAPK